MQRIACEYFDGVNPAALSGELELHDEFLLFLYQVDGVEERLKFYWLAIFDIEKKKFGYEIALKVSSDRAPPIIRITGLQTYKQVVSFWQDKAENSFQKFVRLLYELSNVSKIVWVGTFLIVSIFLYFQGLAVAHHLVPKSIDKQLGDSVEKQFLKTMSLCTDDKLNGFFAKSIHVLGDDPDLYNVIVVKSPLPNAISLPKGKIVFFSAFLEQSESPEEVIGVLAHEMAHVKERHGMRQLIRGLGNSFLIFNFVGVGGDYGDMIELYSELFNTFILLKYSRSFETEADLLAVKQLNKAGISSQGLIQFFERISSTDKEYSWLSTHPADSERVAMIRKHSTEIRLPNKDFSQEKKNWQYYQQACK
ncbi:MAG: M48 family metallopeptidase [Spirochaetota bacterium]